MSVTEHRAPHLSRYRASGATPSPGLHPNGVIDERQWVDPEVQALCGISGEELARLTNPTGFDRPEDPVPQPGYDESVPNLHDPAPVRSAIMAMPDTDVWNDLSVPEPPVGG